MKTNGIKRMFTPRPRVGAVAHVLAGQP